MKIKDKAEALVINGKIRNAIVVHVMVSFLFLSGLFFERYFNEPYKYFFVSPSFYNYTYLSWTTGVWGSVLGIHGTIAALSITFMGMFVGQVSASSEHGFESLSKTLLLRKYNFLEFSIQSVCSLLCGLFLLLIGSGLLGYLVSTFLSLYFIVQYGVMYYKLYNLTEKPEIIKKILFDEIKDVGDKYNEVNKKRLDLKNEFLRLIKDKECFSAEQSRDYWSENAVTLNVFPNQTDIVVSGFNPKSIELLFNKINDFNLKSYPVVYFFFSFLSPLSSSSIKVIPGADEELMEDKIAEIEASLRNSLTYSSIPYIYSEFRQFEEALVYNIRNSLLHKDEWSLDFGVKAFYTLTSDENYMVTLRNLDLSITSSNKKDLIQTSSLANFLKRMVDEAFNQDEVGKAANIMRSQLDLAQYIYSKENYFDFYKRIFRYFENRVKYRADESNYVFLDLYISNVIRNLVYGNHEAFKHDTTFVTSKLNYLDLYHEVEHDSLNETQRKILVCSFEVITLIIMRIEHVIKKVSDNQEELKSLVALLKSWVNAKFFEELYYKKELYDLLFSVPQEYSLFDAQAKIREIPDGEATWRSIANDTYKMIAFILTQTSFNRNRFDLLFIRDGKEFNEKTKILTHEMDAIANYLRSDSFSEIIMLVTDGLDTGINKEKVASKIDSITSTMNDFILQDVVGSELDPDMVAEYIREVKVAVENFLKLILPLDDIPHENEVCGLKSTLLLNKREVILPIDGVSYEMNIHNHSDWLVYGWVRAALNGMRNIDIIEINSLHELSTDNLITIEYKVKDRINVYRHSKGLRMDDEEGYLNLNGPGMYYLDLLESFELRRDVDVLSANIEKIDVKNLKKAKEKFNFEDENPYLYSLLNVCFKVTAEPKNVCKLYYLSEDKCKFANAKQEREMEQLLKSTHVDRASNSIIP
ncbi:hypothetical protein AALP86_14350 [Klebsiella pasteurii]|uniref:hypothetical protein n=1 Tax=Klebsiella pasteurii TaxID=2587529 RepID=UPI003513F1F8